MAAPTPEQAMVYTLLPLAVRTMLDVVTYQAMLPQVEAGFRADPALAGLPPDQPLPADVQAQAVGMAGALAIQQWTDCSVLVGGPRRAACLLHPLARLAPCHGPSAAAARLLLLALTTRRPLPLGAAPSP